MSFDREQIEYCTTENPRSLERMGRKCKGCVATKLHTSNRVRILHDNPRETEQILFDFVAVLYSTLGSFDRSNFAKLISLSFHGE